MKQKGDGRGPDDTATVIAPAHRGTSITNPEPRTSTTGQHDHLTRGQVRTGPAPIDRKTIRRVAVRI